LYTDNIVTKKLIIKMKTSYECLTFLTINTYDEYNKPIDSHFNLLNYEINYACITNVCIFIWEHINKICCLFVFGIFVCKELLNCLCEHGWTILKKYLDSIASARKSNLKFSLFLCGPLFLAHGPQFLFILSSFFSTALDSNPNF